MTDDHFSQTVGAQLLLGCGDGTPKYFSMYGWTEIGMAGWEDIRHQPAAGACVGFKPDKEELPALAGPSAVTSPSFHLLLVEKTPILRAHV